MALVHLDVERIKKETEKAFLVTIDGEDYWLPKSQISDADDYCDGDQDVTLSITEWLAEEKGLS